MFISRQHAKPPLGKLVRVCIDAGDKFVYDNATLSPAYVWLRKDGGIIHPAEIVSWELDGDGFFGDGLDRYQYQHEVALSTIGEDAVEFTSSLFLIVGVILAFILLR